MTAARGDTFDPAASRIPPTFGPARVFLIGQQQWTVEEIANVHATGNSLVFSSIGVARRVRNYPTNWRALTDNELAVLKDQV